MSCCGFPMHPTIAHVIIYIHSEICNTIPVTPQVLPSLPYKYAFILIPLFYLGLVKWMIHYHFVKYNLTRHLSSMKTLRFIMPWAYHSKMDYMKSRHASLLSSLSSVISGVWVVTIRNTKSVLQFIKKQTYVDLHYQPS